MRRLASGRIQVRYRDQLGRERSFMCDTVTEAKRRRAEVKADLQRGQWFDPAALRQPFGEFVQRWKQARTVRDTTLAASDSRLNVHLLAKWQHYPIGSIDRLAVQSWINELTASDLQPSTVRSIYSLMHTIMEAAVDNRSIPANPCHKIRLPPPSDRESVALSPEQAAKLVSALHEPGASLALFTLATGFRWGEGAGTRRRHVDLDEREVIVDQPLHEARGRLWFEAPKSRSSRRTVPLCAPVIVALAPRLEREPAALLWTNTRGGPLRRSDFRDRVWAPARDQVVPGLHWHDLRATYASWLYDAGIPKAIVAGLLGHKLTPDDDGPRVTGRYLRAVPGVLDRVVSALSERIEPAAAAFEALA